MERIAVECSTKGEWDAVQQKAFDRGVIWVSDDGPHLYDNGWSNGYVMIFINEKELCCGSKELCKDKITSAAEYLKGRKDRITIRKPVKFTTKENKMQKNISDVFDKTKDALLVEKYLGDRIEDDFLTGLVLADKKVEVLAEAKRLEKEDRASVTSISKK